MTDKRTHRYDDEDVLSAVRVLNHASAKDVAKELDMTKQGVFYRLNQLRDEERVKSEKIGNTLIWTVAD